MRKPNSMIEICELVCVTTKRNLNLPLQIKHLNYSQTGTGIKTYGNSVEILVQILLQKKAKFNLRIYSYTKTKHARHY